MQLFFEPEILTNNGFLNKEESHHCIKVLRKSKGDRIKVMDGKGNLATGIIIEPSAKQCQIKIEHIESQPFPSPTCHIAIAPTKSNDRFEWFLEKSTEIGIETITPIICKNSERKVVKPERFERIITSAAKQSLSLWKPNLMPITSFEAFISMPCQGDKYIAHCKTDKIEHLFNKCTTGQNALILIGPEGDFTDDEIEMANQNNFTPVTLGTKRLRTETAALVACHTIRLKNEG